jgi:hypothetical protein
VAFGPNRGSNDAGVVEWRGAALEELGHDRMAHTGWPSRQKCAHLRGAVERGAHARAQLLGGGAEPSLGGRQQTAPAWNLHAVAKSWPH